MRSPFVALSAIAPALFLTACSSVFEPNVKSVNIEEDSVFSSLPSLTGTVVRKSDASFLSCLGRGADATFAQSDTGDVSISLISTGNDSKSDQAGSASSSGESEMAGRTPGVLLAREMFYRTCEFSSNYKLSKAEAMQLYLHTLDTVSKGWSAEVEKTTITIGETLTVTDTNTTTDTSDAKDAVSGGGQTGTAEN